MFLSGLKNSKIDFVRNAAANKVLLNDSLCSITSYRTITIISRFAFQALSYPRNLQKLLARCPESRVADFVFYITEIMSKVHLLLLWKRARKHIKSKLKILLLSSNRQYQGQREVMSPGPMMLAATETITLETADTAARGLTAAICKLWCDADPDFVWLHRGWEETLCPACLASGWLARFKPRINHFNCGLRATFELQHDFWLLFWISASHALI